MKITNKLSKIGTARAKIGNIKLKIVACLKAPSNAIILRINPKKFAPESPINIFAGYLLYTRNPKIVPANISEKYNDGGTNLQAAIERADTVLNNGKREDAKQLDIALTES